MLMGRGGHDGNLVADDDRPRGEGDEYLAHDDVANVAVGLAEVDHQAQPEDAEGDAKVEADGLVASRVAYQQTRGERAHDGTDGVGLGDIAGIGDAEVVHYLQEGAEIAIPAVETHKQHSRKDAGARDRTIQEERIGDECNGGEESLPCSEQNHKKDTKDQQADGEGRAPPFCLQGVEIERQEEKRDAGRQQHQANGIKLAAVMEKGLPRCALTLALRYETLLSSLAETIHHEPKQRQSDSRNDDRKCSKTPPPARPVQKGRGDGPRQPAGDQTRRRDERQHEAPIAQRRRIGHEDAEAILQSIVPNRVKNLRSRICLDAVARRHHDQPQRGEDDAEEIALRPAEDVEDLGEREVGNAADDAAQEADGRRERVLREGGGDVGRQRGCGAGEQALEKVREPD